MARADNPWHRVLTVLGYSQCWPAPGSFPPLGPSGRRSGTAVFGGRPAVPSLPPVAPEVCARSAAEAASGATAQAAAGPGSAGPELPSRTPSSLSPPTGLLRNSRREG